MTLTLPYFKLKRTLKVRHECLLIGKEVVQIATFCQVLLIFHKAFVKLQMIT